MGKKIYTVKNRVDHDQKRYEPTSIDPKSTITLDDEAAAPLLAVNAIEFLEDAPDQLTVPTDPKERQAAIIEAIRKLDPENGDLWLRDGKPDTSAIAALTGWAVPAPERNAAWLALQS